MTDNFTPRRIGKGTLTSPGRELHACEPPTDYRLQGAEWVCDCGQEWGYTRLGGWSRFLSRAEERS